MSLKSNLSPDEASPHEEYLTEKDLMEEIEAESQNWLKEFLLGPYWVVPVIILVAISAFSLGKVQSIKRDREPVKIINPSQQVIDDSKQTTPISVKEQPASVIQSQVSQVVGSKNSNKYHYPWCSGAKRISKENLVTFDSIEEARAKGYVPASNCQGLK